MWGAPIYPRYQVGESIIAYAESLGFLQFTDDSEAMVFYIGGDSWASPDVRAHVSYNRRNGQISASFNYADGESSTHFQIIIEDTPEWVGGYDDFPSELAEHLAEFLLSTRASVYSNNSGSLMNLTRMDYESYYIRHNTDGVITEEEENWPY